MLNILSQRQERARRSALSAGDSVCVHGENLHFLEEALEKDEFELLTKAKGAYHEATRKSAPKPAAGAAPAAAAAAGSGGGAAASGSGGGAVAVPPIELPKKKPIIHVAEEAGAYSANGV